MEGQGVRLCGEVGDEDDDDAIEGEADIRFSGATDAY